MSGALALACPHCGNEVFEEAQFCHLCGAVLTERAAAPMRPLLPMQYGALWRRFLACAIDIFIVLLMFAPSWLVFTWILEALAGWQVIDREDARFLAGMTAVIFFAISDWIYNARQISSSRQATLGKHWMGLKVTGLYGERISFGQATGRYFAKYLSTFALFVGFLIAAFSQRRQALHDMVAGTLVLKSK